MRQVRPLLAGQGKRRQPIGRLSHERHVRDQPELHPEAVPDQRLVIGDANPSGCNAAAPTLPAISAAATAPPATIARRRPGRCAATANNATQPAYGGAGTTNPYPPDATTTTAATTTGRIRRQASGSPAPPEAPDPTARPRPPPVPARWDHSPAAQGRSAASARRRPPSHARSDAQSRHRGCQPERRLSSPCRCPSCTPAGVRPGGGELTTGGGRPEGPQSQVDRRQGNGAHAVPRKCLPAPAEMVGRSGEREMLLILEGAEGVQAGGAAGGEHGGDHTACDGDDGECGERPDGEVDDESLVAQGVGDESG